MASRENKKESSRGSGPAEADTAAGKASNPKRKEEALEAADQETNQYPDNEEDYDDDHVIWNLNRMRRLNLMTPEWIEETRRDHLEHLAVFSKDLSEDDDSGGEEVADEAAMAEFDEFCKNIFANVDLSGLNTAGGESCGVDAVGVYAGKYRPQGEDDAVAAEES